MSIMLQGLTISLASILITFAFFGLLVFVMVLLREAFKAPPEGEVKVEQLPRPDHPDSVSDQESDRLKAAGIAVLVASLKAKGDSAVGLGKVLESPPSRWWRDARRED